MGSSSVSMRSSMGSSGDSMGSSSMEADIYVKASDQVGICQLGMSRFEPAKSVKTRQSILVKMTCP
eukprot:TRINITY_DN0_c125_g1_i1.p2 TRINITY_DN0_c125_g1~~TRINITY_DN0_c125_g1_i1.p2  ORF type:complete len:66 (+),score=8.29 TRINITY_DN0_c125_g1_i1:1-198(+)